MVTVSEIKSRFNGRIKGQVNRLGNFYTIINDCVDTYLSPKDLKSNIRKTSAPFSVYSDIYTYPLASDIKGNGLIDIIPQNSNNVNWSPVSIQEFRQYKASGTFAIERFNNTMRLAVSLPSSFNAQSKTLEACDNIGTWTAGTDVSNIKADSFNYQSGAGSIMFDIALGNTTAEIYNTGLSVSDLTDYKDSSSLFVWVYLPDATEITSFTMKWGSDISNYYSDTATTTHEGNMFATGWNLIRFDWIGAIVTGTPVITEIDYVSLTMNKTTTKPAVSGYRIDNIVIEKGNLFDTEYYSKYFFTDSTGAYKEYATNETDYFVGDNEEIGLVLTALEEMNAWKLGIQITTTFENRWSLYVQNNPSARKIKMTQLYKM